MNKGTTTNVKGEYSINVGNLKAVLVFSFVGFVTKEVPVNNQTQINLSLDADELMLSEVVVVGYGEVA